MTCKHNESFVHCEFVRKMLITAINICQFEWYFNITAIWKSLNICFKRYLCSRDRSSICLKADHLVLWAYLWRNQWRRWLSYIVWQWSVPRWIVKILKLKHLHSNSTLIILSIHIFWVAFKSCQSNVQLSVCHSLLLCRSSTMKQRKFDLNKRLQSFPNHKSRSSIWSGGIDFKFHDFSEGLMNVFLSYGPLSLHYELYLWQGL